MTGRSHAARFAARWPRQGQEQAIAEFGGELGALERAGEYPALIDGLRDAIAEDRRVLVEPAVKKWCGRRWRNLFVSAAAVDPAAVKAAGRRIGLPGTDLSLAIGRDERPDRQKIAERFLVDAGDEWRTEMPAAQVGPLEGATLVFCPGLINSMLPMRAFQSAFPALERRRGWGIISADAHPMRGCEANMEDLLGAIEDGVGLDTAMEPIPADEARAPESVILVGYSKGTSDALRLLAQRPDLSAKVRALFCWGGAVGGSYLADNIYESIKDLEIPLGRAGESLTAILRTVFPVIRLEGISQRLDEYDIKGAIRDLTTTERDAFLALHADAIDALDLPIFNLTAATRALEVPHFQVQGYLEIARHDPDNDMQLTQDQARMKTPMATDLAVMHAHHWDISYDPFPVHTRLGSPNLDHPFPREAAMAAIFELSAELGLLD